MSNEKVEKTKNSETFEFQAEVSRVLDIVINSLYTDKEIFVRELISNAVDAMEKRRYHDLVNQSSQESLEISIKINDKTPAFSISDSGIGMNRQELIEQLGKIAHSGALEFIQNLSETERKDVNLIGQFGVGFYSVFMVADKVVVKSRSVTDQDSGWKWTSDGQSQYTIEPADGLPVGTTIELVLKDDAKEFASDWRIKDIIKRYSGFVPFPIKVNDEEVNTMKAIWTLSTSEVEEQQYTDFYKYLSPASSDPIDKIHFSTDAPLSIKALLFIPSENPENFGLGRTESEINLYSRKVLIQPNAKDLLPQWLRFIKGVVDSEDIPLNISRETMQDSALMRKINRVLTKRILKYFKKQAKKSPDQYKKIWDTFGVYIKEGLISEFSDRDDLAELLRFETSMTEPGTLTSLHDYIERMPESQESIYFIAGASREAIEAGPYVEVFKDKGIEVIYNFDPVDDFVMHHLSEYKGKKTVSADSEKIDLPESPEDKKDEQTDEKVEDIKGLTDWIRSCLQEKVADVKPSTRLIQSPMILVNPDGAMTGAMQKLMQAANKDFNMGMKRNLQFNPQNEIIQHLDKLRQNDKEKAAMILDQLYDHAALDAGLTVETRSLVNRMNQLIKNLLD